MKPAGVLCLSILIGLLRPSHQLTIFPANSSKLNTTTTRRPITTTKNLHTNSKQRLLQPEKTDGKLKKRCGIPVCPTGMLLDPSKLLGIWYEYMYKTPPVAGSNSIYIYTALTNVSVPGSANPALAVSWINPNFNVADNRCLGLFHQSNFTLDGRKFTATWIQQPGVPNPNRFVYYVLYTDYKTIEISYRCNSQKNPTDFCEDPYFWVTTRVKPAMLTASTRSFITSKVNFALSPYCMGTADLNFSPWLESLGTCSPKAPAEFIDLIQSFSKTTSRPSAIGNSVNAPLIQQRRQEKRCGIPVTVTGMQVNPSKLLGTWYEYMYKTPPYAGSNPIYIYAALKNVSIPGSSNPAVAVSWINPNFNVPDNRCLGLFHQSNFTADGRKLTTTWIQQPGVPNPNRFVYYVLYTNYNAVEISYRCNSQKNPTTFCEDPYFWVTTRIKPAALTDSTRSFIASKINSVLGRYCMGATDLSLSPWDERLGKCNPTAPEDFTKVITGISRISRK